MKIVVNTVEEMLAQKETKAPKQEHIEKFQSLVEDDNLFWGQTQEDNIPEDRTVEVNVISGGLSIIYEKDVYTDDKFNSYAPWMVKEVLDDTATEES